MTLEEYIDQIKFELTGDVLCSDITDESYAKIVKDALKEINRYYDNSSLIQVSPDSCIDLTAIETEKNIKINCVVSIYRTKPTGADKSGSRDPMAVMQWNILNNFANARYSNMMYNYMAANTIQQISNTLSTDLDFKEDKAGRKLYVNYNTTPDSAVVLEYIPVLEDPSQVVGDYWTDILYKLSLAKAKIILGRLRTRFTQDNALWKQDGETMLSEGAEEIKAIRDRLTTHSNYVYPLD